MQTDGFLEFSSFEGGVNYADDKFHLAPNQFLDGNNITIRPYGRVEKREGKTLLNTAAFGSEVYSLHPANTGVQHTFLAKAGSVLYEDPTRDGIFTVLKSSLHATNPISGFVYDTWFYYCDGTNMYKYDLTNHRNWGIAAPTTAITATPTGSGSMSATLGGYIYAYTYIRGTEAESAPKQSTSTGNFTSKASVAVVVTASADAQVTYINLYRALDGGSVLYFHSQVANTTATITDTSADSALTITRTTAALSGNIPPTSADFAIKAFRRVILGTRTTRVIQISEIGGPEYFPGVNNGYTYTLNDGDGNLLMGMVYFQNAILFFKDFSLIAGYNFDQEDPLQFEYREIGKGLGIMATQSLASGLGLVVWVSSQAGQIQVLQYDGTYWKNIGGRLEPKLNAAPSDYMSAAVGWLYDNKYFLSFPYTATSTTNDCIYFYDFSRESWFPHTKDWGVTAAVVFNGYGDDGELYCGDANGYVDRMDVEGLYTDRGVGYKRMIQTRFAGDALRKKLWNIYAEGQGNRDNITVVLGSGKQSKHTTNFSGDNGWNGGDWNGGDWQFESQTTCDEKLKQGMKHRYASVIAEEVDADDGWNGGSWNGGPWNFTNTTDQNAALIYAAIDYEVERRT